jgi:hypothetical protein
MGRVSTSLHFMSKGHGTCFGAPPCRVLFVSAVCRSAPAQHRGASYCIRGHVLLFVALGACDGAVQHSLGLGPPAGGGSCMAGMLGLARQC